MRIEEAAARAQARIDSGSQTIVGVNKYRLEKEDPIDILEVDNTAVRKEQIENLKRLKEGRNQAEVDKALAAITECVKTGKGNLLELAVEAAHVRATLGEISYACEQVVGRYKAIIRTISACIHQKAKATLTLSVLANSLRSLQRKRDVNLVLWLQRWARTVTIVVPR